MEDVKPVKKGERNHLRAIIIAVIGFGLFTVHVFLAKGSTDFVTKFLHGDLIYVANFVMTIWVIIGWFLVYKYMGKLLK